MQKTHGYARSIKQSNDIKSVDDYPRPKSECFRHPIPLVNVEDYPLPQRECAQSPCGQLTTDPCGQVQRADPCGQMVDKLKTPDLVPLSKSKLNGISEWMMLTARRGLAKQQEEAGVSVDTIGQKDASNRLKEITSSRRSSSLAKNTSRSRLMG